jgi:lactoylglutathione lyase
VIKTEGLTHIHLVVQDLDRSLAFYQQAFGMEELFRDEPDLVFLRTPGSRDTITLNGGASERAFAGKRGGVGHFGFRRAEGQDLEDAIAQVKQAGGRLVSRGERAPGDDYAYVEDPDGYAIEL